MAPPEIPGPISICSAAAEDVLAGASVPNVGAEVIDAEDAWGGARVGKSVKLDTLDEGVHPITRGKVTTPTLLVQQAVLSLQHHRSLSARPLSHGVIRAMPKESRTWSQTLRHLLMFISSSA
jgi:hypothetical protein